MINFLAAVQFPKGSGLSVLIYGLLRWVYGLVKNYGLAIILFTVLIRVIVLPLDFLNKYFTKKNAAKLAVFKDEDAELKKQYADNPMKYLTARRDMYRRNGYSPGASSLVMIANVVLTLFIFITVFRCLGAVSTLNIDIQSQQLHAVYVRHEQAETLDKDAFRIEINEVYDQNNSSFLWVHDIFRPDTWASKVPSHAQFTASVHKQYTEPSTRPEISEEMYNAIFKGDDAALNKDNRSGWNGFFILIILSAVTMFFSTKVNMATMKKQKQAEAQKETEVGYSMRKAKSTTANDAIPQINPEQMQKMMAYMLPAIMVMVTFTATAAFALYITAGAVVQTSLGIGTNSIVGKILKKQEENEKAKSPDKTIINPHSRYFKKRYEK